ncbi:MAG: TonB-dependent receptor [Bacteroidetes bacterium]|nr:TonB-dependent receptor [Fibrella sp.]
MKNVLLLFFLTGFGAVCAQVPTSPDSSRRSAIPIRDTLGLPPTPQPASDGTPPSVRQAVGDSGRVIQPATPTVSDPGKLARPAPGGTRQPAGSGGNPFFGAEGAKPAVIPGTATDNAPRGSARIAGIVLDSASGKPVEYASVALVSTTSNKPIDGTVCDDKGRFIINKVVTGDFRLLVSFVGYRNRIVTNVKIDRKGDDINVGIIKLASDVRTLNEVEVVGQTSLVEEKVDRMVYNAEKDITNKGGDATDVMRKVPMLSVDLDGNVSLRGNSNVRVLINNKPSTIVASSVADALKQIPADMIKTVEVITSPSAKYDAEGSAGIINIVTKKNNLQGFTLNLDSGVGNRGTNLGLNGNLRTGKMGFSLSGFGRAQYNVRGRYDNEQTTFGADNNNVTNRQSAETRNRGVFGQYTLGWDYDISKTSAITASVRYGARNNYSFQDNLKTVTTRPLSSFSSENTRNVNVTDLSGTVDVNLDYTRTFAKPQQELSLSTQYSRNNRTNNYIADLLDGASLATITGRLRNDNDSYNQESTVQADYQSPISTNQQIEFGGKGIFRQVESQYRYLSALGDNGAYADSRPNNALNYDQNVTAGYLSYTYATKSKFTIKAGARYEYTTIDADTLSNRTDRVASKLAIPNYGNLVPSINISKALKGGKTVKLAYNRRLQRPGIQFLNPNVNQSNPTQISEGNPNLAPELTDNFELSSSTYIKTVFITASLFGRLTNNSIESVRDTISRSFGDVANPVLQRIIRTSYQNIGRQQAYGTNVFINATLFSKWQLGGGFDAYYAYLTNNSANPAFTARNSGLVVTGRLFTSLTLKNGWGVQGFSFIRGRQVQLQGYQGGFAFYSLGVKKDLKNKRGSFGLAGENFFNFPFTIKTELESVLFRQSSTTSLFNAGVRANFSYKFGKLTFDQPQRRKKSVNNDDVKGGEGGGDGGGQQPQPQQAPAGGGARRPRG